MKMPFDYVDREVDKLYQMQIDATSEKQVSDLISFIAAFINAAGWTEEEYLRALFGFVDHSHMN